IGTTRRGQLAAGQLDADNSPRDNSPRNKLAADNSPRTIIIILGVKCNVGEGGWGLFPAAENQANRRSFPPAAGLALSVLVTFEEQSFHG
ncbi:MAG: hypothetical protein GY820_42095, partial [Gammaproteobacteria bacterium]|nr:hypothetical protein [Gammaproteobacteria bacterium]